VRRGGLVQRHDPPILARLERFGWLAVTGEVDPYKKGRLRRRERFDSDRLPAVQAALHHAEASKQALRNLRPSFSDGAL
jgi:hypothetical protein